LGVSKFESRQCQKLAGIPQERLDQYIRDLKATKQPIFVRSVLRWADAHASSWSLPGGNEGCRPPCGLISPQAAPSSPSDTAVIRDLRRLLTDIDELLAEVRNHLATLAGILDGTGESLTVSQRGRIVGYYLAEVVVSLQRLRNFQVVLAQRVLVQTDGPTTRQGQLQGG